MGTVTKEVKELMVFGEYSVEDRGRFVAVIDPTGCIVSLIANNSWTDTNIERAIRNVRNKFKRKY